MSLQDVMPSEVSWSLKDKHRMVPLTEALEESASQRREVRIVGARGRVQVTGNEINCALMVNVMICVLNHNFTKKGKLKKGLKSPRGQNGRIS